MCPPAYERTEMDRIYVPLSLKLHAYGLSRLHDPNWTGCDLFDRLKQHVRGRIEPVDMLRKTLRKGLLYHLGLWIQEDYFENDGYLLEQELKDEYRAWYLEDAVESITRLNDKHEDSKSVRKAKTLLEKIDDLYSGDDDRKYFDFLESEEGIEAIVDCYARLHEEFESVMPDLYSAYAWDYAERVFHDRQLCAFISELLVTIGFDGMDSPPDTEPQQWIDRVAWPEWALKAVRARDRGCCASCQKDISLELAEEENIDHIVPLSRGGTNDLVNLQLLCRPCNLEKYNKEQTVKSSIPSYLRNWRKRRS
jgi:hypothetical protein